MAGTIMRSTQFRSIVEPILNQAFDGVYDQRTDEYKKVFTEETGTPRAYHEEVVLYGMGAAPVLPDGQAVTYDEGGQLYVSMRTPARLRSRRAPWRLQDSKPGWPSMVRP